ncbi:MAG: transcriptional regulator [Gammaproteobacteria bacterium]|nr:MAG: transcriptional regulator [Gammaproteobacteria bacterium]TNE83079.1 MAG: transcriptional regulator [Gammaproteobacteria bacterium]
MNIKHHLDEATLFSYVAGALGQGTALVTACHLSVCEYCRNRTRQLEAIGGALLENSSLSAVSDNMLLDVLEKLDAAPLADRPPPVVTDSEVPAPLADYIGESLDAVAWKRLVAGVWIHDLPTQGKGLTRLLRVSPGKAALPHTHRGSELTQLLRGSFTDEVGRFTPGDVADLDDRITHQPLVDGDQDCICLIATEYPLRYTTLLGKIAQPIFGF